MWLADPDWVEAHLTNGLSSGEGLLWAVRDPVTAKHPVRTNGKVSGYEDVIEDHGVDDKRLLVMEAEFASPVRRMARDGNSLSALLRECWDTGDLRVMTTGRQRSPVQATDAYVSIVAHTTRDELLRVLDSTEYANGFANRFLWVCVRRSNVLPHGGSLDEDDLVLLGNRTRTAIASATGRGRLRLDMDADDLWCREYPDLSAGEPGLLGAITGRAEAQTIRLALLYALLDGAGEIRLPHLSAALALWRYCHDSVRCIFRGESW
ncbi:MAG: DUF3987 domain-containing protein [Blastocatellia bacterium]|nr:DUF3987 domain-containing protein [Blastocatellia bacterium]